MDFLRLVLFHGSSVNDNQLAHDGVTVARKLCLAEAEIRSEIHHPQARPDKRPEMPWLCLAHDTAQPVAEGGEAIVQYLKGEAIKRGMSITEEPEGYDAARLRGRPYGGLALAGSVG